MSMINSVETRLAQFSRLSESIKGSEGSKEKYWVIRILSFGLLFLTLSACTLVEEVPTLVPDIRLNAVLNESLQTPGPSKIDESPRPSSAIEIPPTWTPGVETISQPQRQPVPPINVTQAAPITGQQTYVVQSGDTLGEIAIRFNVVVDSLAQANGITDLDHIEVGQVLVIPGT